MVVARFIRSFYSLLPERANLGSPVARGNKLKDAGDLVSARGERPLSFQWYLDSKAIKGATKPVYRVPRAKAANGGRYKVRIENAVGAVVSKVVNVTVD